MGFDELLGRRVTAWDFNDVREEPSQNGPGPGHSWVPTSLIDEARNPPAPPTIGGVLYPAKRTLLSGETESLKTWLALVLCQAEMDAGFTVGWVDLDAMGPADLLERLRALGCTDEVIHERFLYYTPHGRLDGQATEDFTVRLKMHGVRLCVIDAFNPILTMHGYDPNSVVDVERFWTEIADPICRVGACPALIDHVVKDPEHRGKYATGSERKASGCIVHIGFRLIDVLSRGKTGSSILSVHKDRPGFLPRPTLGKLVLASDGEKVVSRLERSDVVVGSGFRPTFLMARVSERVAEEPSPVSKRWVVENVKGKDSALREAVDILTREGFIYSENGGQGGGKLYSHVRQYFEFDDDPLSAASSEAEVRPTTIPMVSEAAPLSQNNNSSSEAEVRPLEGVPW